MEFDDDDQLSSVSQNDFGWLDQEFKTTATTISVMLGEYGDIVGGEMDEDINMDIIIQNSETLFTEIDNVCKNPIIKKVSDIDKLYNNISQIFQSLLVNNDIFS